MGVAASPTRLSPVRFMSTDVEGEEATREAATGLFDPLMARGEAIEEAAISAVTEGRTGIPASRAASAVKSAAILGEFADVFIPGGALVKGGRKALSVKALTSDDLGKAIATALGDESAETVTRFQRAVEVARSTGEVPVADLARTTRGFIAADARHAAEQAEMFPFGPVERFQPEEIRGAMFEMAQRERNLGKRFPTLPTRTMRLPERASEVTYQALSPVAAQASGEAIESLAKRSVASGSIKVPPKTPADVGVDVPESAPELKSGMLHWIAERTINPAFANLRGGAASSIQEGALIRESLRYRDPAVKRTLTETIPRLYEGFEGRKARDLFLAAELRRSVSVAAARYAKTAGRPLREVGEMLESARRRGDLGLIPDESLREATDEATTFIDNLSQRFIDEGMLTESQAETFAANMGKYMNVRYAKHGVENWANVVRNTAAWEDGFRYLKETYPELSDAQIYGHMTHLAGSKGQDLGSAAAQGFPRQLLTELKHRKDIPAEIRGLMGVSEDFLADFDVTTAKMIHDLEATRLLRSIREEGLRTGLLRPTREATEAGVGHTAPVVLDRITGETLYTTPEMAEVFTVFQNGIRDRLPTLAMLNGLTKFGKVVLSPQTHARNVTSIAGMLTHSASIGSALVNPKRAAEIGRQTARLVSRKVFPRTGRLSPLSVEDAADMEQAHELGLIGTGAFSGEMEMWGQQISRAFKGEGIPGRAARRIPAQARIAGRKLLSPIDTFRRAYTSIDDAGKFMAWQAHKQRLSTLIKSDTDKEWLRNLTGTDEIDAAAAEIVKNTMQHFPRTAAAGKKISRFPFLGTFPSFSMEITRNVANSARYAASELRYGVESGQTRFIVGGMERVAGIAASLLAFKVTGSYLGRQVHGMSSAAMESMRRLSLFEWNENSDVWVTDKDGPVITYIDAGYSNPADALSSILTALVRPGDLPTRLMRAAEEIEEIYLGREIFLGATAETLTNTRLPTAMSELFDWKRRNGHPIYNMGSKEAMAEAMYYWMRSIAPGGLVSADRIFRSFTGSPGFGLAPESKSAREFKPSHELLALFAGPRIVTIDSREMLKFKAFETRDARNNLARAIRREFPTLEREEKRGRVAFYASRWEELQDIYIQGAEDAKRLGASPKDVEAAFRAAGLSQAHARAYTRGRRVPFDKAFTEPEGGWN